MSIHALKTDPEPFGAVACGAKKFEIRFNDRNYVVGDELHLRETLHTSEEMKAGLPLLYTGNCIAVEVTYVMRGPSHGLQDGWAILGIKEFE